MRRLRLWVLTGLTTSSLAACSGVPTPALELDLTSTCTPTATTLSIDLTTSPGGRRPLLKIAAASYLAGMPLTLPLADNVTSVHLVAELLDGPGRTVAQTTVDATLHQGTTAVPLPLHGTCLDAGPSFSHD